jgi:putative lysine transport system permease protein
MWQIFLQQWNQLGVDIGVTWARYGQQYLGGMWKTIYLAVLATLIGCVIGFICGILNTIPCSKRDNIVKRFILGLIRVIIRIYVEVFRGTPMILQAVFIYYGLPYFTGGLAKWPSVTVAALVVVSINTGAYMAESVRGGFLSIDPGQTEGAKAIGMTHVQTMLYVIIPQALRVLLPQIGNNLIINIKDTSVMFIISYGELFSVHRAAVGALYLYFPSAAIEMVAYLTMTLIASLLLRLLEKKLDGNSNYDLVAEDQLVTAAGTYNHPAKGSPSDERNPEAQKSMMREELRRQAEQEAARQKGKVATVRRENTNPDQRGDL